MEKTNGRELSDDDKSKMREIVANVEIDSKKDEDLNPLHMFRGELLYKTIIIAICWITVCVNYYKMAKSYLQYLSVRKTKQSDVKIC